LSGYKFRRQHTLGDYYLDFFCEEAELNTELDNSQHGFPDELQTDAAREKIFASVRHLLVANHIKSNWFHPEEASLAQENHHFGYPSRACRMMLRQTICPA
jgi:hypothetical protein